MDLLEKFAAVEVKADNRISETDKFYCEQHQAAYKTVVSMFKELMFVWADMQKQQDELLGDRQGPFYHDYLAAREGLSISEDAIKKRIEALHSDFIRTVVYYFNSTYHVTVSSSDIKEALLPKEPNRWRDSKETVEEYHKQMQNLIMYYPDIVDQIILRLDGRSFAEQAFQELYEKCHNAAWNTYKQEPEFERKKDTIRFSGYFCKHECWVRDQWAVQDSMKNILRGLAHYETGVYNVFPLGFSDLIGYRDSETDLVEFTTCEKVKHLKMFKNGRVNLKFTSERYAEEFIEKYLGTVC